MGTSFNIFSKNSKFEVACFTGKVQVKSTGRRNSVILTPGLFTKYQDSGKLSTPASFDSDDIISWQNSEFYFTNSSLEKVLTIFENHYHITVHRSDLTNRNYTGYFPKNDMKKALNLICIPMNLEYKILNSKEIKITDK
jgi:ferric-dicitrate binding protein FerR (iron transport regulator)